MNERELEVLLKELTEDEVARATKQYNQEEKKFGACPPIWRYGQAAATNQWTLEERQHVGECPYCQKTIAMQWRFTCPERDVLENPRFAGAAEIHIEEHGCSRCRRLREYSKREVDGVAAMTRVEKPIGESVPAYAFGDSFGGESDSKSTRIPTVLTKRDGQEQTVDIEILKAPEYVPRNRRVVVTLRLRGEISEDISSLHVSALIGSETIPSVDEKVTLGRVDGETFEFEIPEEVREEWCQMPQFRLTPTAGTRDVIDYHVPPLRPRLAAMRPRVIARWPDLRAGLGESAAGAPA